MHQPDITVLMPVYNAERYLREAVDSILCQSYQAFELLLINDGSSDASSEILAAYDDPRIRLVHNPANLGLIETLNRGLALAQGQFLARMDADDISHPNRLALQREFLASHPKVAVCGGSIIVQEGTRRFLKRYPGTHQEQCCGLLFDSTLPHPGVMLRMQIMRQQGICYDPAARHAEDYDLWCRLAAYGELAALPDLLLTYRRHENQISHQQQAAQQAAAGAVRRQWLARYGLHPSEEQFELHQALGILEGKNSRLFWRSLDAWLVVVLQQLKHVPELPSELLGQEVMRRWLTLLKKELQRGHVVGCLQLPSFVRQASGGWPACIRVMREQIQERLQHADG